MGPDLKVIITVLFWKQNVLFSGIGLAVCWPLDAVFFFSKPD